MLSERKHFQKITYYIIPFDKSKKAWETKLARCIGKKIMHSAKLIKLSGTNCSVYDLNYWPSTTQVESQEKGMWLWFFIELLLNATGTVEG